MIRWNGKYTDFLEFCRRVEILWSFWGGDNEVHWRTSFQQFWIDKWNTIESI